MPARGKHRRTRVSRIARAFVPVGTGGVALALPFVAVSGAHAAQPAGQVTQVAEAAVPQVELVTHKVAKGDTLTKIAKKHGTSGGWQGLYKANRAVIGNNPSLIKPGLTLTVGTKKAAASPAAAKSTAPAAATQAAAKTYSNDLDGWIKAALDIMAQNGIPGSYDGIHRNVMRESSGNPQAINNWDSNAAAGTPSKGLLQTIDPTFRAYHVPGTSTDPFDPVANIVAACNYAADRYGSIDNVNGPY
ncbi:transglycosylase SLT domain-containing protein [Streptomyces sp. NBC_00286]|uniref:transglycosylase SLT domain-containing protein n=1 Tax=Streptomyces sp. NBC_00286 TaxID=2975701 RepID=UPI002E2B7845|nr:LysM peptidoglycan-binding domain-containing protein [Streptomyces sp. NBC_00286]